MEQILSWMEKGVGGKKARMEEGVVGKRAMVEEGQLPSRPWDRVGYREEVGEGERVGREHVWDSSYRDPLGLAGLIHQHGRARQLPP